MNAVVHVAPLTVTPAEAARLLGCGRTTVFALLSAGEIKSFLYGRKRLIPVESLRHWVERQQAAADAERAA